MCRPHFVYSSVDGHLDYFHLLATVYRAIMNMSVQIAIQVPAFNSSVYLPRCGIAGFNGNSCEFILNVEVTGIYFPA